MVRTKRAKVTKASGQGAMPDTGDDAGVMAVATAGDGLQERQRCAFAKVLGNALFGDAISTQLMAKMNDDPMSAKEPEPAGNGFSQAAAAGRRPSRPPRLPR